MDISQFFINLFVLTFSICTGLILAFRAIWPLIENRMLRIQAVHINRELSKDQMQLRLAAYERLLLFSYRITPEQVMLRHHDALQHKALRLFHAEILADIQSEFQHNFAQQLYVSDEAWAVTVTLKNNTLALFRNIEAQMNEQEKCDVYISRVLSHVKEIEPNPYIEVQHLLKKEMNFMRTS